MPILRNTPVNLKDDDQFLVNRDGTDYQATARRLKRYMHVSMPQEDPVSGQWFHIKNVRGGKLKIKTEGVTPIAVDVLGEAVHAAWYDQIGSYHYGHSIRIFASEEAFDWDKSPWGDVGDLADAIHGDHDEETVEKLISDLGYNRDNFFGTYNHPEYGRGESEFLEILPTSLVAGNGAEVPNNHQYLVYVGTGSIGQRIFQPDRGCTYEIGPLTNTAGITNWNSFFKYESNFVPYLGHIDVSGGTIFKEMFYQAQMGNKPELRCWQVGNGQDFEKMFEQSDFDADLSNWDMSNATNMQSMFRQAKYFSCMRRDIGKWRPNETAKMSTDLFYQCPSLELDVSEWVNTRPDWTEIRNSWNEHTLLRMKDGSLQGTTTSSMCNDCLLYTSPSPRDRG